MVSKILGIDYGRKRIGLALADSLLRIAVPRGTLAPKSRQDAMKSLCALVSSEHVEKIVMGLPLTLDRDDTKQTGPVFAFAKALNEKTGLSVVFQDERFTSIEAKQLLAPLLPKDRDIDGVSAQIILQTYLDTKRAGHFPFVLPPH
ncbi:Holliday junction resolvase RuvX [Candidatus Peregrinibacteria bacterium]|nr:Holliday junction resolvase RuvX [Candidatus Peregrinibacteria bacterium]